jgi:hypothetical protein
MVQAKNERQDDRCFIDGREFYSAFILVALAVFKAFHELV